MPPKKTIGSDRKVHKNPTGNRIENKKSDKNVDRKQDPIGFPMGNPIDDSDQNSTFRSEISIVSEFWAGSSIRFLKKYNAFCEAGN